MKRTICLVLSLAMILGLFAGCGGAEESKAPESSPPESDDPAPESVAPEASADGVDWASKDSVSIRIGHTNSETDSRHTMLLEFADLMKERTGGKVEIEVYGGGVQGETVLRRG